MLFNPHYSVFLVVLAGQVACRPLLALRNVNLDPERNNPNPIETDNISRDLSNLDSVECCTVTLMPTTLSDGSPGVQVVRNCSIAVGGSCPPSTQSIASPSLGMTTSVSQPVSTSSPAPSSPLTSTPGSTVSVSSTPSIPLSSSATDAPSFSPPLPTSSTSSSTSTSSTPDALQTSTSSAAVAAPQGSIALGKVIGAFAGVAILCLIVGGTLGYLKQKKLKEKNEQISWPVTR